MRINNFVKTLALATTLTSSAIATNQTYATKQNFANNTDIFCSSITNESINSLYSLVTPQGTTDKRILAQAPSPVIKIAGVPKKAGIVVDIDKNIMYRYDRAGNAIKAYAVASGAPNSPTTKEIRIVTHIEQYPYDTAKKGTKRRRNPKDYGPYILCLNILNPNTGKQSPTGEFIHGYRNYYDTFEKTPDRHVTHGCVRTDAIVELVKDNSTNDTKPSERDLNRKLVVKPGEIVIIK